MRSILFLCLFLPGLSAHAQEPIVPDTTAPWLYYPLAVGNTWEYRSAGPGSDFWDRVDIPGDTLIGERRYFVQEHYRADIDADNWALRFQRRVRFDTLKAQLVRLQTDGSESPLTCPFDRDFWAPVLCDVFSSDTVYSTGQYIGAVSIGDDQAPARSLKLFDDLISDVPKTVYVAPIGDVGKSGSPDPLYRYEIVYARLVREDGTSVEYGAGAPVASDPPATPAQELTIAAYPNPFTERLTLRLTTPSFEKVVVEVFDVLGRRVHVQPVNVSSTSSLPLEVRDWTAGLYLIRVTTARGEARSVVATRS